MNILPDTINGALILSVVDFILSFIFISFIGIILHFFPLLNKAVAAIEGRNHHA